MDCERVNSRLGALEESQKQLSFEFEKFKKVIYSDFKKALDKIKQAENKKSSKIK